MKRNEFTSPWAATNIPDAVVINNNKMKTKRFLKNSIFLILAGITGVSCNDVEEKLEVLPATFAFAQSEQLPDMIKLVDTNWAIRRR